MTGCFIISDNMQHHVLDPLHRRMCRDRLSCVGLTSRSARSTRRWASRSSSAAWASSFRTRSMLSLLRTCQLFLGRMFISPHRLYEQLANWTNESTSDNMNEDDNSCKISSASINSSTPFIDHVEKVIKSAVCCAKQLHENMQCFANWYG